ncbi:MAG: DEAD/DEAH box helicase family protein [Pyrinomonadaceae bacterium]
MKLKLEELKYQQNAIESVVKVFEGAAKNTFDNATIDGIRFNRRNLSKDQLKLNIKTIAKENGIAEEKTQLSETNNLCVEMETGTGKTLVYLKTIYELYKHYGFTKFIVLVPSVAIRQGILASLNIFGKQLQDIYGFTPDYFEYSSKKLHEVGKFAEEQYPQIMIMTTGAIVGDDKIINREQREDLFDNTPYIDVIGKTNPIVIMDEPQEGMDAPETKKAIERLNPLFKIRYSATHKEFYNLIYRLTPYDSYRQNLVKKIEVLTVVEKNDEATLKIELSNVQTSAGDPKVKLKAWIRGAGDKIEFKETAWLKKGDNLGEKSKNSSYLDYVIENIRKDMFDNVWRVRFTNGVELIEKQNAGNIEQVWAMQTEFLIKKHFAKAAALNAKGIKCLSLVFINRVSNYIGENPVVKNLFTEKYREIYPQFNGGKVPTDEQIEQVQGYYFARNAKGEFSDNEGGIGEQKRIYDLILRQKEELLALDNPVEFIFSHSALGVGWDNPNVFNIATMSASYSEIKKRQEIGRGLRICVNQKGERVYDAEDGRADERINQLTVIPNETYETFARQYQEEIKEIYGTAAAGAGMTHTDKDKKKNTVSFIRNSNDSVNNALKKFWAALARKTEYTVAFDEERLVSQAVERVINIKIAQTVIAAELQSIDAMREDGFTSTYQGDSSKVVAANFSALDLIEELSEETKLSYRAILKIIGEVKNHAEAIKEWVKNPPLFVQKAASVIKDIEAREMLRGLTYHVTGEAIPFDFDDYIDEVADLNKDLAFTPNYGVYDKQKVDSQIEKTFAETADADNKIVCVLKLPKAYRVKTPIGFYEPDFGIVLKRKEIGEGADEEYHFVVETKGTAKLGDMKALKESETYKMNCALKHFEALGVKLKIKGEDIYKAPIKEYREFKREASETITKLRENKSETRTQ